MGLRFSQFSRLEYPIEENRLRPLNLRTSGDEGEDMSIWTVLFIILLIAWLGGFTVFHVASGLIHLLLIFAVISLILHFVLGRRTV